MPFIEFVYLPWLQKTVFLEELGGRGEVGQFGAFPPYPRQNVCWSVCVRRAGGAGARQSITADAHKAHFMGIREAAV